MVNVSVIIPVYNVEEYLEECLDSVINQTFKDIEIICINDGSTDSSLNILNNYAKKDTRMKIYSQKNQGQGSARNFGLNESSGDYVYFVDSDDCIELNTIEELYNNISSNNSDIVVSKIARFNDNSEEIDYSMPGFDFENQFDNVDFSNFTFNYRDIKQYVLNRSFAPWMKLYKRKFLTDNNIYFIEDLAFEDVLFHVESFLKADSISFSPNFFYFYRNNPNSTMNTSEKGFDIFEIIDCVEKYLYENGFMEEFKEEFVLFKVTQILNYILSTKSEDYFQKAKIEFLKIDLTYINKNDYLVSRVKLVLNSNSLIEYSHNHFNIIIDNLNEKIINLNNQNLKLTDENKNLIEKNGEFENKIKKMKYSKNKSKFGGIMSIKRIVKFKK